MQWFLLPQLTVLIVLIITSVRGQTEEKITELVISTISASLTFCWEGSVETYVSATLTVLENSGGITQNPVIGTMPTTNCASFPINPSDLTVSEVTFVLQLFRTFLYTKTNPDGEGMVRMVWPDLTLFTAYDSADNIGSGTGCLRVHYTIPSNPNDELIVDNNKKLRILGKTDITQDIVYYIFSNNISPTTLKVCSNIAATINGETGKSIRTCQDSITVGAFTSEPEVSEALLEYSTPATTVKTKPSGANVYDKFEMVNYYCELVTCTLSAVCSGSYITPDELSLSCDFTGYQPGTKSMNILVVGYGVATTVVESRNLKIKDYKLEVENIFTSMIEMRWEVSSDSIFMIEIKCDTDLSGTYTTAEVTCTVTSTGCFGYFLDIPPSSTCTTELRPMDGGNADNMNIIAGLPVTTPTQLRRNFTEIQIKDVQVTWQQEGKEASTRVCFTHESNLVTASFSHYEFVIVNNIGKWLKHKLISQDKEDNICFSPFIVNTEAFDVTEGVTLVVTQRAEDGFTVLGGGETRIKFYRNL